MAKLITLWAVSSVWTQLLVREHQSPVVQHLGNGTVEPVPVSTNTANSVTWLPETCPTVATGYRENALHYDYMLVLFPGAPLPLSPLSPSWVPAHTVLQGQFRYVGSWLLVKGTSITPFSYQSSHHPCLSPSPWLVGCFKQMTQTNTISPGNSNIAYTWQHPTYWTLCTVT